jgi:chloride channel 3/4/5
MTRNERYGNFHTIDWLRDLAKDRFRHKWLVREAQRGLTFEKVQAMFDAASGWLCVLLVGLGAGLCLFSAFNNS